MPPRVQQQDSAGSDPVPIAALEAALDGLDRAVGILPPGEQLEWRARFVRVRVMLAERASRPRLSLCESPRVRRG